MGEMPAFCHFQGPSPGQGGGPEAGVWSESKKTSKTQNKKKTQKPNKLHQKQKPKTSQFGTDVTCLGGFETVGAQKCSLWSGIARPCPGRVAL